MENWKVVTALVTVFAFLLEIRPMDSFLTAYLTGPEVHVTLSEVSDVLTPIRIQFGVVGTFLVFLLTDYVRYKPIMIFNGMLGVLAFACLTGSPTIFRLKVVEVCLSLFTCAELSYYGYLFAKIKEKEQYQKATGCAKAGAMSGMFVSGILGQVVVYFNNHDYSTLPYYSLPGMTLATIWAFFLPSTRHNKYFHVEKQVVAITSASANDPKPDSFLKKAICDPNIPEYTAEKDDRRLKAEWTSMVATNPCKQIYEEFKYSYTDPSILWWSLWHIIGQSGYAQIILYVNVLYTYKLDVSDDKNMMLFNGFVDSIATMSAAICAYNVGKTNVDWTRRGNTFLAFSSLVLGLTMCLCFFFKNIFLVYAMFICYDALVQSTFVIVISQIAKRLKDDCYTLVLGFNTFLSITICALSSTFLTAIEISIPGKFLVYGGTYVALGIIYGCAAVIEQNTAAIDVSTKRFHQIT